MRSPVVRLFLVVTALAGCQTSEPGVPSGTRELPIQRVPADQQRHVDATEFGATWPLSVRSGRLGCVDGAVVFQSDTGVYAINSQATQRGWPFITPLWRVALHGPASNPLKRIMQDERMTIFRAAMACPTDTTGRASCRQRVRTQYGLSGADLEQIETEGEEQVWPPLTRERRALAPLIEAGLTLCRR